MTITMNVTKTSVAPAPKNSNTIEFDAFSNKEIVIINDFG